MKPERITPDSYAAFLAKLASLPIEKGLSIELDGAELHHLRSDEPRGAGIILVPGKRRVVLHVGTEAVALAFADCTQPLRLALALSALADVMASQEAAAAEMTSSAIADIAKSKPVRSDA
jgi:hypothetical protein